MVVTAKKISNHIRTSRFLLPAFVAILIVVGTFTIARASYIGVSIDTDNKSLPFYAEYSKTIFIAYPLGGSIRDHLNGQNWQVTGSADSSNPDVQDLMDQMNQNILDFGSQASVSDLEVSYTIHLKSFDKYTPIYDAGRACPKLTPATPEPCDHTSIDYTVVLEGTISNLATMDSQRELFDRGWSGFNVHDEVVIDGVEINIPMGILEYCLPETYKILAGTKADHVLLQPIIDVGLIREQSIADWHFHRERNVPQPDPYPDLGYFPVVFDHYWTHGELESDKVYGSTNLYAVYVTLDQTYFIHDW